MSAPHRIDVHHHILPPEYVASLAGIGVRGAGGVEFPSWSPEAALAMLDQCGIQAAVTSISSPGVHFGDASFARDLARRCNEASARLVQDHPARFGAFATVPLPDVKGALLEVEHALDTLELDGIVLLASQSDGRYLGDPRFDDLIAELDRRQAVVFVHPTIPKSSEAIPIDVPGFAAEFTFDTSRAILNLIWSGTAERFPNVRWIFSHAGGTAPFLAWRWSLLNLHPTMQENAPLGALHYLGRFFYDTALAANPHALRCLTELVEPARILFGSDYPFAPAPIGKLTAEGLEQYDGFDGSARAAIERDNALALLPGLRARIEATA
ncbi:MAG: amidohydrolase family protein [Myxococcota bacterium]|nr:amidohydrolase family protein [Myxococcota bacterium]